MAKKRLLSTAGQCVVCEEFTPERIKGMCRRCYNRTYYERYDPLAFAGRQQRELDRAGRTLSNVLLEIRKLKDCGMLSALEFVSVRKLLIEKLHQLEMMQDQEADQMIEEELNKARDEDREIKLVPDPE